MATGNILAPVPDDLSIYYLTQIFGNVGTVLTSATSPNTLSFLGTVFQAVNTIALTVGAFILVYVTVVGLLATAHEGEFMGKNRSGLWVPIRTVMGIAALFPASSGYSAIQIIFMWIIVQGVGAADLVWNAAVKYTLFGSPYVALSSSSLGVTGPTTTMNQLFQGLVCQENAAAATTFNARDPAAFSYYPAGYASQPYSSGSTYSMGPNGACGILTLCDPKEACATVATGNQSASCAACQAQGAVVTEIINTVLRPVAQQFVLTDTQYVQFYELGAQPAEWILQFCKAKGVPAEQCCNKPPFPGFPCAANITWFNDYDSSDLYNVASGTLKNFYEPWSLFPLLVGGGTVPVNRIPSEQMNTANFIQASVNTYQNGIAAAMIPATSASAVAAGKWQDGATKYGWITAGMYYFEMAKANGENVKAASPDFSVSGISPPSSSIDKYRNNISAASSFITDLNSQASHSGGAPEGPEASKATNAVLKNTGTDLIQSFVNSLTIDPGQNPLAKMASFGNSLLNTAQYTYTSFLVAGTVTAALVGASNTTVLGSGTPAGPWYTAFQFITSVTTPLLAAVLTALFTYGGLLGIYIPLIPYVVFTVTVLGWFIATIEAMVAAPLVALGILGHGQHEILGRAEPAMMIMFNLFLRPAMMVIGLVAALLLAGVMVMLINQTYVTAMYSVLGNAGNLGPGQQFVAVAAYVALMFTVMSKVFTLIHLIPARVLMYIGGHEISYGEAEAAGAVKHGVEAAAGAAAAGAAATVAGGAKGGMDAGLNKKKVAAADNRVEGKKG